MAATHFRMSHVSRGKGRSAVAVAAYNAREKLYDARRGEMVGPPKSRRKDLEATGIEWPQGARKLTRQELWNKVEAFERRTDSRTGRKIIADLDRRLSLVTRQEVVREYAGIWTRNGYAVDWAIHNPPAKDNLPNPHVHFAITPRPMEGDGFAAKKDTRLDSKAALKEMREAWQTIHNRYLAITGHEPDVDLRSYAARGIDRIGGWHLGPAADRLERQGVETKATRHNKRAKEYNATAAAIEAASAWGGAKQWGWEPEPERIRERERER